MLTDTDRHVLDIAARPIDDAHRAQAVWDELRWTETRYAQRLNQLIDNPDAWAYAPAAVKRWRRIRARRRVARTVVAEGMRRAG